MKQNTLVMHRYVIGLVMVMGAIAATFPIALWRVSQDSRYGGQVMKSETCDRQSQGAVSWWQDCRTRSVLK
jgi:hypothetical protein